MADRVTKCAACARRIEQLRVLHDKVEQMERAGKSNKPVAGSASGNAVIRALEAKVATLEAELRRRVDTQRASDVEDDRSLLAMVRERLCLMTYGADEYRLGINQVVGGIAAGKILASPIGGRITLVSRASLEAFAAGRRLPPLSVASRVVSVIPRKAEEAMSADTLAHVTGLPRQSIYSWLQRRKADDQLQRTKIGDRFVYWWQEASHG